MGVGGDPGRSGPLSVLHGLDKNSECVRHPLIERCLLFCGGSATARHNVMAHGIGKRILFMPERILDRLQLCPNKGLASVRLDPG